VNLIERLLHISPDQGDGTLELFLVAIAVAFYLLVALRRHLREAPPRFSVPRT